MRRCQLCRVEDPETHHNDGYTECCNELVVVSCDDCDESSGLLYFMPDGRVLCSACRP